MTIRKSMTDVAYTILKTSNEQKPFDILWKDISQELGFSEAQAHAKIAVLYTQLITDGRFITIGENIWDLRERTTFDKIHVDMNDVYGDDDEIDLYDEDAEDSDLYDDDEEEEEESEDEDDEEAKKEKEKREEY